MKLKINYTDEGRRIIDSMFNLDNYDGRHTLQSKIVDVIASFRVPKLFKPKIKILSMKDETLNVEATEHGYSILRLAFYSPYYKIEVI